MKIDVYKGSLNSLSRVIVLTFSLLLLTFSAIAQDAKPAAAKKSAAPKGLSIDKVISATKRAAGKDRQMNATREKRFKSERNRQQGRLNGMVAERAKQERISDQLDNQYKANEVKLAKLAADLAKELGDLKELFGVIQQTATEAQEDYKTSLISAHYPDRAEGLRQMVVKMASETDLVSIKEIEGLWFQLQNDMTEQGKIVKFNAPVRFITGTEKDSEGKDVAVFETQERSVTRVGVFNAVTDNDIAVYRGDGGGLTLLDRQMNSEFTSKSKKLQKATEGVTPFLIDPSKGVLLSAFVKKPTVLEKVTEGKMIGYLIILLGVIALIIAVIKIVILTGVENSVKKQAKDLKKPSQSNPLGRVLKVYQDNPTTDAETMELKLSESILKETPKLNSWLMFVKIIAVVAPLLGLLGTVTGMIQTFQAITLYGAGDPQTMAGGISQALVTTVLGLVVAIPTVFLHWMGSSRARRVEDILEEHATGLVANQVEANH